MDKTAIKKFATTARLKLTEAVKQRAFELGVTKNTIIEPTVYEDGFSINGHFFRNEEIEQREHLLKKIEKTSFIEVIDEVAYTWFNRFIAIRFMEVNDYLPTGIRLLSSIEQGKTEPDALTEVSFLIDELQLNRAYIYELEDNHEQDQLFKYIIIQQCNQLGEMMPLVFEEITGYTALLLPDYLLTEQSVITDLIDMILEDNWQDVEIVGWLYQYYNAEKKDEVFAALRKNVKITKQNVPAATQLFTPRWIVEYMVDNSLGRYWLDSHDNDALKEKLSYYLDDATQPKEVVKILDEMTEKKIDPESITFLDPSMGSGHVLIYAFEVLYEIYLSQGYRNQDIPTLILEKNLYGLEIDDRATQLAYFILMMKARAHNHRIFHSPVSLNICAIQESNLLREEDVTLFTDGNEALQKNLTTLINTYDNGKLFGSIIEVPEIDVKVLLHRINAIKNTDHDDLFMLEFIEYALPLIEKLVKQTMLLKKKYNIVVTNPPYMGRRGMNPELAKYVRKHYKDSSADLSAVFMEVASNYTKKNGFIGMINQHSWMFLSSFETLRKKLLHNQQIYSMAHLGTRAFSEIGGEVVQTTAFILRKSVINNFVGTFVRLTEVRSAEEKASEFFNKTHHFNRNQIDFINIPGSPVAYWISNNMNISFKKNKILGDYAEAKQGVATGNNNLFLRYWYEPSITKIGIKENSLKWIPLSKGGSFRKWYGNNEYVINWENDGFEIKNYRDHKGKLRSRPQNLQYFFKKGMSWSTISSGNISFRLHDDNYIFETKGSVLFPNRFEHFYYIFAYMNSKLVNKFLSAITPTLDYHEGPISKLPLIINMSNDNLNNIVKQNIFLSKSDWDAFETSWDFETHPFIQFKGDATTIEQAYEQWEEEAERRFNTLKTNEETLNKTFIDLYGLQDELTSDVADGDVTVRKADQERDVKSFLSYLVGVMFGRYSLDQSGLVFAGGEFNISDYESFTPDNENIIPITDEQYFEDDIVERIIELTKLIFGETHLEDNFTFIADTLTRRRNESSRDRIRRYFLKEFYKDHVRIYQKRPIYWQIDSGRNDGFKALIYLHRYKPNLLSRVRTQYLHPQMKKYENETHRFQLTMESDVPQAEKTRAKKAKEKIEKQIVECQSYDQVLAHMAHQLISLDLDDGVKVNYDKFQAIDVTQGEGKRPVKANIFTKI